MEKKRCDAVIGNKIIVYLHGFGSSGFNPADHIGQLHLSASHS